EPVGVAVSLDVEASHFRVKKLHQVQRRQVAGGVVQEHILAAGVGGVDAAVGGAGVPVVDDGVVLQAGVSAGPGGVADLVPEVPGLDHFAGFWVAAFFGGLLFFSAPEQRPLAIGKKRFHERVGHAHGVVGVLARNGD